MTVKAVDVIGVELEEARRRLTAAGVAVGSVVETRPPRPVPLTGALRVVRSRPLGDGTVELIVVRERYQPPGPPVRR